MSPQEFVKKYKKQIIFILILVKLTFLCWSYVKYVAYSIFPKNQIHFLTIDKKQPFLLQEALKTETFQGKEHIVVFINGNSRRFLEQFSWPKVSKKCQQEGIGLIYLTHGGFMGNKVSWYNHIYEANAYGYHINAIDKFNYLQYNSFFKTKQTDTSYIETPPLFLKTDKMGSITDTIYSTFDKRISSLLEVEPQLLPTPDSGKHSVYVDFDGNGKLDTFSIPLTPEPYSIDISMNGNQYAFESPSMYFDTIQNPNIKSFNKVNSSFFAIIETANQASFLYMKDRGDFAGPVNLLFGMKDGVFQQLFEKQLNPVGFINQDEKTYLILKDLGHEPGQEKGYVYTNYPLFHAYDLSSTPIAYDSLQTKAYNLEHNQGFEEYLEMKNPVIGWKEGSFEKRRLMDLN